MFCVAAWLGFKPRVLLTLLSLSLWTPVAQRLVGAAYQDHPGKQEGLEATPRVWRDKERDSDLQAAHEPGQHSSLVPADPLPCAGHRLGVSCINEDLALQRVS